MVENNILVSVIIPTKNRKDTLIPTIRAISKNITDDNLEIIINDNSNDNSQEEVDFFISTLNDPRIKYHVEVGELSIVENTIRAIEKSKGSFLTFIGDDDTISPKIIHFVNKMVNDGIESLIYEPGYYWWPTLNFKKSNYYFRNNVLWLPVNVDEKFQKRNSEISILQFINSGAGKFGDLPKLYHGILSKRVLDKIKLLTGTYLPGPSPDISFSLAIALTIPEYYYVRFPISIFGASKSSGGGWTVSGRHFGKIEDQDFLPKNIITRWDRNIPKIWSEKTIYAQSSYEVFKSFNADYKINYLVFYASMLIYEPFLFSYWIKSVARYCKFDLVKYIKLFFYILIKKIGKVNRNIKFKLRKIPYHLIDVNNLDEIMNHIK